MRTDVRFSLLFMTATLLLMIGLAQVKASTGAHLSNIALLPKSMAEAVAVLAEGATLLFFPIWVVIFTQSSEQKSWRRCDQVIALGGVFFLALLAKMVLPGAGWLDQLQLLLLLAVFGMAIRGRHLDRQMLAILCGMSLAPFVLAYCFFQLHVNLIDARFDEAIMRAEWQSGAHAITRVFLGLPSEQWNPLVFIAEAAYILLPHAVALCVGLAMAGKTNRGLTTIRLLLCTPILAIGSYYWLPATGPKYLFGAENITFAYDWILAGGHDLLPTNLSTKYNCFPSFHVVIAMQVWFVLRQTGRLGQVVGASFAALTAGATLITGEHYVTDLFASVPMFAIALAVLGFPLQTKSTMRRGALVLVNACVIAAWVAFIRQGGGGEVYWALACLACIVGGLSIHSLCKGAGEFAFKERASGPDKNAYLSTR